MSCSHPPCGLVGWLASGQSRPSCRQDRAPEISSLSLTQAGGIWLPGEQPAVPHGRASCLLPPTLPAWELLTLVLQGAGILCASEAGSHNTQGKGSCTSQQVKFPYPLPGQAYPCAPAKELGMGSFLQLRKRRRNALCIWLVFESQNWQG